jgi:hypothetical protein
MSLHPIGHTLVIHSQCAPNPSNIHLRHNQRCVPDGFNPFLTCLSLDWQYGHVFISLFYIRFVLVTPLGSALSGMHAGLCPCYS